MSEAGNHADRGTDRRTDRDARREREELCDLLLRLGPDAPTLCAGWATRDLAAHLVIREQRPFAAAGLVVPPLAGRTARVQQRLARGSFDALVAAVRQPPWYVVTARFAPVDRAVNTMEMFIHHEDVRRGQPEWTPRDLPGTLSAALWQRVRTLARLRLRRFSWPVTVAAPGYGEVHTGRSDDRGRSEEGGHGDESGREPVQLRGAPGELLLFLTGRQRATHVEMTGPQEAVDRLGSAGLAL